MADVKKFIDEIKGMTVLELSELVKAIEEEFGVSAAATAVAAGPAAGLFRSGSVHAGGGAFSIAFPLRFSHLLGGIRFVRPFFGGVAASGLYAPFPFRCPAFFAQHV